MKKLIYSIISMMLILFYAGCHKSETPNKVFTVLPNGTDDTQNLIKAFEDAKAAGTGSKVELQAGQYSIRTIEVHDFDGYFLGAGKGKTIISSLPDLPCDDYWNINNTPCLMQFVGGSITISDMTIHISDGSPCGVAPINDSICGDLLESVLVLADYTSTYVHANRQIKGVVKNVDFISGNLNGGNNPYYGTSANVNMVIYCGSPFWTMTGNEPLSNGEISITGCEFEQGGTAPDVWGFGENSIINIENNNIKGMAYGMFLGCNLGGNLSVKNNKIQESMWYDLYIDDSDYGYYTNLAQKKRTAITITGNDFQSPSGVTSLLLVDSRRTVHPNEGFPQLFDVKENSFNIQAGGMAIMGLNNVDAKFSNNVFTGDGSKGIYLDTAMATTVYAENALISGNNFSGANYSDAHVYLGTGTKNCTVNAANTDIVIDNGTGNTITGGTGRYGRLNNSGYYNPFNGTARKNIMMKRKP